jgi:DUF1680 family protein
MDGVRKASAHEIVFQSRAGTPELNCCSVNGARGFGLISDWALMQGQEDLFLNWYGPSVFTVPCPRGGSLTLRQDTEYPRSGMVILHVTPSRPSKFALNLRVPAWSAQTRVRVNGVAVRDVTPGSYLRLDRKWKRGDRVMIDLDMSLHFWVGERECEGRVSVYRGPILLTYDRRFNPMDPDDVPALDARRLRGRLVPWKGHRPPVLLTEFRGKDGRKLRLCDFGSAGEAGSPYQSWLCVENAVKTEFSPAHPLRSGRS